MEKELKVGVINKTRIYVRKGDEVPYGKGVKGGQVLGKVCR